MAQSAFDKTLMGGPPYFDDFDEAKRFLKVLFRPGRPLQSRELAQVQSILQNQIERFGRHIFQEGSVATGGSITDSSIKFVRITDTLSAKQKADLVGKKLKSNDENSNVNAVVIGVEDPGDPDTESNDQFFVLCIQYITAGTFVAEESLSTYGVNDPEITVTVKADSTSSSDPSATGEITNYICMDESIFFSNGYFVLSENVRIAAHTTDTTLKIRDFSATSCSIGFDVNKTIIDADDDSTLNDPAFGFYNYNSPGADRYKITFTPVVRALSGGGDEFGLTVETGNDYIEIVRIVAGNVTKKVKYPQYASIESTLARRTFDESGNYTVTPFNVTARKPSTIFPDDFIADGPDDLSKTVLTVSSGKAYLNGYEFEGSGDNAFILDRPRNSTTLSSKTQGLLTHYEQNTITPNKEVIDGSTVDVKERRRVNLANLGNIIGGQKRIYLLDEDGKAVGSCYIQQVFSRLGVNQDNQAPTVNTDSIGYQLFNVESLGSGNILSTRYISERYVSLPLQRSGVPSGETIDNDNWTNNDDASIFFDFFIMPIKDVNGFASVRKGTGRYYQHVTPDTPTHSSRPKFFRNLKMLAFKSFTGTASNGEVTIDTGGRGLIFATDRSRKVDPYSTSYGSMHFFNFDYTVMLTEVLSSSVSNTPADLSFPSIGDFTFNFSDDQTSLVLGGLKNSAGNDYSGDVVISAPVILDYSIEEHEEQRVVRKAMNFNDNVFSTVEETIPEDSLSFCDSNGDGKLDGSDKIFLSKQFLRAIVSVKMNGDDLTQKFKQRDAVTQGRSSNRGSESSLDNRVERAFIQLEPNEDIVITGPLVVKYRHYNTDTYADGGVNDGEIIIANSFAFNAGADAAQNPTFDDIAKSPYILSQSIEYGGKGYQHLDFRGYEYVTDAGDRVGSDNSTSPQSEFNRAFTFGKDKDGGFMPVDVQGEAGVEYTAEFYNHVPLTLYLDEDRKLKLFTGTPALLLDDGFAELKSTQMRIADIRQYGYGIHFNDLGVIPYDNQRTTMAEINEIEKEIIENEQFDRLDALESKAFTQAKTKFRNFSPVDHGTFIDTFEDWHSAWTTQNAQFNSSIDIFNESLRPNFTNFYTSVKDSGITGSDDFLLTDDNLYLPAGSTVDFIRTDTANANETATSRVVNPNGVVDFHGYANATPFTDNYWNTLFEPVVTKQSGKWYYDAADDRTDFVHPEFGDVFKKNGNGVNYRDHELHWYGVKESEISPQDIGIDGSHTSYIRRRKPKSIRRAMNNRPTRKENVGDSNHDKLVDEALRYRGRNYTVTVDAFGLKPNTDHRVFNTEDGTRNIPVGRGAVASFTSSAGGTASFTFEHPEVLSGEEYYLITDSVSDTLRFNGIRNSTSSADFFIQNTGLYRSEEDGIKTIRPIKPRRDASNLATYENRYYENIPVTSTVSYNSFSPITQTFTVDAVGNPNGIFMESIDIYFKQVATDDSAELPVIMRVHPVVDGVPNYNKVLPFSEVHGKPVVSRATFAKNDSFSRFKFSSPMFLPAGEYAFTVETNDSEYIIHTATESEAVVKPENVGNLFVPSNNGQSEAISNEFIRFRINRMEFNSGNSANRSNICFDFTFADYAGGTASNGGAAFQSSANLNAASYYVANAPRLFTTDTDGTSIAYHIAPRQGDHTGAVINAENAFGGLGHQNAFNHTLSVTSKNNVGSLTNSLGKLSTEIRLGISKDKKVANVIDADRLGIVAQRFNLNGPTDSSVFGYNATNFPADSGTELRPRDAMGTVISRYYSKIVFCEDSANDLVVFMNGTFPKSSRPVVMAKVGKTNAELESSPYYICTFDGNSAAQGDYLDDGFPTNDQSGENDESLNSSRDYAFRISPIVESGSGAIIKEVPRDFKYYRLKVLMLDGLGGGASPEDVIKVGGDMEIKSLSAIAGISDNNISVITSESKPGDESYLLRLATDNSGANNNTGVAIQIGPGTNLSSMQVVGNSITHLLNPSDFLERKLGVDGSTTTSVCKVVNNTAQPCTYLLKADAFLSNATDSAADGHVRFQKTAALTEDFDPEGSTDSRFDTITLLTNDFGGGSHFGAMGNITTDFVFTLDPGQRQYFRMLMVSTDSNSTSSRRMQFLTGGFRVRRLT